MEKFPQCNQEQDQKVQSLDRDKVSFASDVKEGGATTTVIRFADNDDDEGIIDDDEYQRDDWDEGGRSDCGYSDGLHDTLMHIGEGVYRMFGEPSEIIQKPMRGVGTFFQEASYAIRDFKRGNFSVKELVEESVDMEEPEGREDDAVTADDASGEGMRTAAQKTLT